MVFPQGTCRVGQWRVGTSDPRLVLSLPDTKGFFLVDGLDEREPKEQLDELARKMVWISQLPNVKLCVSCRPWHGLTQNLTFDAMLCIDQLTYSDMEFYLQSRLRRARTIAPIHSDFQEKTAQVERLMHDIIHAAEGVFLWLELMANELVRAICKNSNLKGLRRVFEESPPDLNAYLTTQIYQRIPKGKSNVSGTASALKLAMVIHRNDERPSVFFDNPQSVVNFWLLQNGYLTEEMSWYNMGVRLFSMPEREQMAQATKRFLSESCRDLVVTHRTPHFNSNAEFIHRSVFYFLNSGDIKLEIEKASPKHFEDDDFLDKLSKMRPLLLFRGLDLCCFQMHSAMAEIVNQFFEKQRCERRFLSVCDRILAEHVLDTCACFGQLHQFDNQAIPTLLQNDCTESVLALFRRWPHVATFGLFWLNGIDWNFYSELLGGYLNFPSISISELIKFVLMCGLPLNRLCNRYQQCGNTLWAKWLVESKRRAAGTHSTVDALRRWQKQTAEVASLMIQHGADPTCLVCVAKHPDQASCIHVSIDDVFDSLFHPGYISQMRSLLAECSRKTQYRSAQRKQRLRGVRVFLYSVQSDHANERLAKNDRDDAPFWRDQRIGIVTWFLHDCMNGGETTKTCLTDSSPSDHHRSFVASYCKDCDRDVSLCVTCFYSWDGTYDLLVANAFGNSEIANPRCVHAILISSFHKSEASSSEDFADQVLDAIREWYQSDPLFEEEIIWPSRTRARKCIPSSVNRRRTPKSRIESPSPWFCMLSRRFGTFWLIGSMFVQSRVVSDCYGRWSTVDG